MVAAVERILEQARTLKPDERSALIDALYALAAPVDQEWEAAWIDECEDRLAALDDGRMVSVDFDAGMAEALARLRRT